MIVTVYALHATAKYTICSIKINPLKPYFPAQANRWMDNPVSSKFKDEGFAFKYRTALYVVKRRIGGTLAVGLWT